MTVLEKFENWLNETLGRRDDNTTHRDYLFEIHQEDLIQKTRESLRDDFILYRYRFINNKIIREECYMAVDNWYIRTETKYSKVISCYIQQSFHGINVGDKTRPVERLYDNEINTFKGQYAYFDHENDEEVYRHFLQRELERQEKALKELNTAQERIKSLQEVLS